MSEEDQPNKCPGDQCRQLDDVRPIGRSQSLSSTIMDYYNRYGQNRDLEKYFRFRRHHHHNHHHGRSSSDESCLALGATQMTTAEKSASASQLPTDDQSPSAAKSTSDADGAVSGRKAVSVDELRTNDKARNRVDQKGDKRRRGMDAESKEADAKGMHIQVVDSKKASSRKKDCSMTSTIEINITNLDANPNNSYREPERILEHSGTQTSCILVPSNYIDSAIQTEARSTFASETKDNSIPKTVKFLEPSPEPVVDEYATGQLQQRPTSADSSIVSMGMPNKPRLEWDSLGDVGYDKSGAAARPAGGEQLMSTFERATLRKFFSERGLVFDENFAALDDPKLFGAKLRELDGENETREDTLGTTLTGVGDDDQDEPRTPEQRLKSIGMKFLFFFFYYQVV